MTTPTPPTRMSIAEQERLRKAERAVRLAAALRISVPQDCPPDVDPRALKKGERIHGWTFRKRERRVVPCWTERARHGEADDGSKGLPEGLAIYSTWEKARHALRVDMEVEFGLALQQVDRLHHLHETEGGPDALKGDSPEPSMVINNSP